MFAWVTVGGCLGSGCVAFPLLSFSLFYFSLICTGPRGWRFDKLGWGMTSVKRKRQQEVATVDNDEWEQRQWTEIQLGRGLWTGITMPMNGDKERHCWNDNSDGGDNGEWGQWTTNRSHRTTDDNEQNDDNEQRRRKAGAVNTTTPPLFFLRVEMWDGFFLSFVLHSWLTLRACACRVVFFFVFYLFYY